ncbi:hypothetical protein [Chromobacterium subtsugae]|uniref:hypothetical protein n=1 Tax=Chromobacterium subtsugae TaxID=251747 RepID=UPI0012FF9F72|nr:hypothetical protein [Chromobacterium subtsugae]
MRKLLFSTTFILGLGACATQPVSFTAAKPVDPAKIFDEGSGAAAVLVKRDSGFTGGCCDVRIFVNGKLRAKVGPGEVVALRSTPGRVIIGAEFPAGGLKEIETILDADHPNKFRVLIDSAMSTSIVPTATD